MKYIKYIWWLLVMVEEIFGRVRNCLPWSSHFVGILQPMWYLVYNSFIKNCWNFLCLFLIKFTLGLGIPFRMTQVILDRFHLDEIAASHQDLLFFEILYPIICFVYNYLSIQEATNVGRNWPKVISSNCSWFRWLHTPEKQLRFELDKYHALRDS